MAVKPVLRFRCGAGADQLRRIREAAAASLHNMGCDKETTDQIVLAINEASMNIIQHAYGNACSTHPRPELILELFWEDASVKVLLTDFADPVDPNSLQPRPLEDVKPGGLGLHFIRQVMDTVVLQHLPDANGNVLRMEKTLKRKHG
ncbi:MAG: ATP-binding protein [Gammaproteobacteria bacterium]|nr:ATP-binding protein [Gammaproteobacteria bacterium]MDH5799340.1 ATP-binding protein [Gammaproteobacteria bacterium]